MRRSYKAEIIRDKISIPTLSNQSSESYILFEWWLATNNPLFIAIVHGPCGTRVHDQILFKDKGHEIISKFSILERHCTPQSSSETCPENRSEPQPESLQPLLEMRPGLQLQPERIPGPELEVQSRPEPQPNRQHESEPQPETQSDSLTELVQHATEDTVEIKSICDRLGSSLIYLEHVLSLGDIVKDVSHSI